MLDLKCYRRRFAMSKFNHPPAESPPSLSRVLPIYDERRIVQRVSQFNSLEAVTSAWKDAQTLPIPRPAVDPGPEAKYSATEPLKFRQARAWVDYVFPDSLLKAVDSFQSGEENNGRGTGVVVYFRTYSDKCSDIEKSTHWYAFPLEEDSSSNPNPPSDDFLLPDYPIPPKALLPFSVTHQSRLSLAVGLGSFIYVIGGKVCVKGLGELNQTNKVCRYNTAKLNATEWEEVAPMNMKRAQFSSAVLDGKIYVQGGLYEATEIDEIRTNWVEYFDPEMGRWEILPPVKFQGKCLPLFDILNPTVSYDYFSSRKYDDFVYTMTPLGPYELVFSSEKSHFPSYVYNIPNGTLVEMDGEKNFMEFLPYEPPIVYGQTRYYLEGDSGTLMGYRFDKLCWVQDTQTSAFADWKFPQEIIPDYYYIVPRADGSFIASQGDQFYVLFIHRFHTSYCEIRCKRMLVSHDIETRADQLDVRMKPSISRFIAYGENLLNGLLL